MQVAFKDRGVAGGHEVGCVVKTLLELDEKMVHEREQQAAENLSEGQDPQSGEAGRRDLRHQSR